MKLKHFFLYFICVNNVFLITKITVIWQPCFKLSLLLIKCQLNQFAPTFTCHTYFFLAFYVQYY